MDKYADLELCLRHQFAQSYSVEFTYSQPDSDLEVRLGQDKLSIAQLDPAALQRLILDPKAYGQELTKCLFADPNIYSAFTEAVSTAQNQEKTLRFRLRMGPRASELHSIHWETLRDPKTDTILCTNERILFSRYLTSQDWRPARMRRKGELRALVVIASPNNLADYQLQSINVDEEIKRASDSLENIPIISLPIKEKNENATLKNIIRYLRGGSKVLDPNILYLVCHGTLVEGESWLFLEDENGGVKRISGSDFVTQINELRNRPSLIILGSCESAGTATGNALTALGPRLAEAGIPAVLAMQGKISMKTLNEFMPIFFNTLQQFGEVDHAVAVARANIRDQYDHWMPTLFMRLKSGRIWYSPGFSQEEKGFYTWKSLTSFIRQKTCTAIVGPGLVESYLGSPRDIALFWADEHGYPLAPKDREDLPRVAQYIMTREGSAFLRLAYRDALRKEILYRYKDFIPDNLRNETGWSPDELLGALKIGAEVHWGDRSRTPYRQLAQLKLPIYINASSGDLLTNALIEEGRNPQVCLCPWNDNIPLESCQLSRQPDPDHPLVYHLFGHIREPFSLVLTEDEFFDFLIGVTVNKDLIPSAVRAALTNTALLFVGLKMDDWHFRVFFRMIMAQEGRKRLELFSHATSQVEPEEGLNIDVNRARKYLEKYYLSEKISLYWGSSEDFLNDLLNEMAVDQ